VAEQFVLGIDLGGTKILSLCLDEALRAAGRDLRPTDADQGPAAVIERLVASALAAAGDKPIVCAGVSTPGPCDLERGIVTTPPNLPGWRNVPLARRLQKRLGVPTWIENDANAAAVAEHRLGAGRGAKHMLLVTVGTGIGGGLILDGRLYRGASGAAGEVGHMQLDPAGRVCGCGRRGCLEALASGLALTADAAEIVAAEPQGILARIAASQRGGRTGWAPLPDAPVLLLAAEAGDAAAAAAIERAGRYLGAGLTNLVDIFNPEVIVIAGSLRKLGDRYLGPARAVVQREAFRQHRADVRIVEAALGDDAAASGAALIALERRESGVGS
jgi:glucokinase